MVSGIQRRLIPEGIALDSLGFLPVTAYQLHPFVLSFSYRFMDMFPDTSLVRDIQKELDDIILTGVLNITRLIRVSEATSGTVAVPDDFPLQRTRIGDGMLNDEDLPQTGQASFPNDAKGQGQRRARGSKGLGQRSTGAPVEPPGRIRGALAARLIQQGLLTQEVLKQLEKEWLADHNGNAGNAARNTDPKGKKRK